MNELNPGDGVGVGADEAGLTAHTGCILFGLSVGLSVGQERVGERQDDKQNIDNKPQIVNKLYENNKIM
jgi:hypothetical protein